MTQKATPLSPDDFSVTYGGRWIRITFDLFEGSAWADFRDGQKRMTVFVAAVILDRKDGMIVFLAQESDDYRRLPYTNKKHTLSAMAEVVKKALQTLRPYESDSQTTKPASIRQPEKTSLHYVFSC